MKKGLKVLALGALALPLGLLSACGGQLDFNSSLNVNNAGAYSASSQEELTTYVETETDSEPAVSTDLFSYRLVMDMRSDEATQKATAIIQGDAQGNVEFASKITASLPGEDGGNINISMYYPGGDNYYADVNLAYRGEMADMNINGQFSFALEGTASIPGVSPDYIFMYAEMADVESLINSLAGSNATVSKAERDNKVNFKVEIEATQYMPASTYYVMFEDNDLVGVRVEVGGDEGGTISIEKYDGDIEYPNFDNYQSYEEYLASLINQ